MRKLSEIKNEDALDVFINVLDPITELYTDEGFRKAFREGKKGEAVKEAVKNHKHAIIEILAALDGEPVETYEINVIQIPLKLIELFNDEDLMSFFQSQGLMESDALSGSAMETTEASEK